MIKIFFAFLVKETYHILRDTRTLIILFGMPITLLLIFGYTVSNEFRGASLSIYDQSKDQLSIGLVQHIVSSGHFKLVQNASSKADFEQSFKSNEVKIGIVIPAKFEQDFYKNSNTNIQIITDASEPNYASTLTNYATQIIKAYQLKHWAIKEAPYQIDIKTRMYYNPKLIGAYNFVPGVVALILMLTSAMMTSLTIAREKETGTMDLLLASPLPPLIIILGKVTPYTILSFLSAVMVFAMGHYLFAVPILGSITLLFSLSLLYLLVALALGVLISTKSPNQQTAMMTSMFALLLPTMLLSGFIFPVASMPKVLQVISNLIPATHFIIIQKAIMLKGVDFSLIQKPVAILTLMFVVLITIALKSFKVIYK